MHAYWQRNHKLLVALPQGHKALPREKHSKKNRLGEFAIFEAHLIAIGCNQR